MKNKRLPTIDIQIDKQNVTVSLRFATIYCLYCGKLELNMEDKKVNNCKFSFDMFSNIPNYK